MKKNILKKSAFVLIFILCSIKGFSALPPFYQSSKEIKHILKDERLHEKLGSGQMILNIIKSQTGWIIITPKYHLNVDVKYIPSQKVGPVGFDFYFHDPISRDLNE